MPRGLADMFISPGGIMPAATVRPGDFGPQKSLDWIALVLARYAFAAGPQSQSPQTDRTLLDTYCVTCHNQKTAVAGLMLDKVDPAKAGQDPAVWEKVVHKLRSRAMPPPGRPRPDAPSYQALITHPET